MIPLTSTAFVLLVIAGASLGFGAICLVGWLFDRWVNHTAPLPKHKEAHHA